MSSLLAAVLCFLFLQIALSTPDDSKIYSKIHSKTPKLRDIQVEVSGNYNLDGFMSQIILKVDSDVIDKL